MKEKWADDDVLLAIDPGSRSAGLALFCLKDKSFIDSKTLLAEKGEWPERLFSMQMQAAEFLENYSGNIKVIVFEMVPRTADITVQMCAGAIASCLPFSAKFSRTTAVPVASWKAFARKQGAVPMDGVKKQDVKGIKAVEDIFGKEFHNFDSSDAADSFLIGLYYLMNKV